MGPISTQLLVQSRIPPDNRIAPKPPRPRADTKAYLPISFEKMVKVKRPASPKLPYKPAAATALAKRLQDDEDLIKLACNYLDDTKEGSLQSEFPSLGLEKQLNWDAALNLLNDTNKGRVIRNTLDFANKLEKTKKRHETEQTDESFKNHQKWLQPDPSRPKDPNLTMSFEIAKLAFRIVKKREQDHKTEFRFDARISLHFEVVISVIFEAFLVNKDRSHGGYFVDKLFQGAGSESNDVDETPGVAHEQPARKRRRVHEDSPEGHIAPPTDASGRASKVSKSSKGVGSSKATKRDGAGPRNQDRQNNQSNSGGDSPLFMQQDDDGEDVTGAPSESAIGVSVEPSETFTDGILRHRMDGRGEYEYIHNPHQQAPAPTAVMVAPSSSSTETSQRQEGQSSLAQHEGGSKHGAQTQARSEGADQVSQQ